MNYFEEINLNNVNIKNPIYCQACLSSDRALFILGDYVELFRKICDYSFTVSPMHKSLCWECIAMLRKLHLFKTRANKAQKILNNQITNKQYTQQNSLSNLTICSANQIIDVIYEEKPEIPTHEEEIEIKNEDEIEDYEPEIKQEIEMDVVEGYHETDSSDNDIKEVLNQIKIKQESKLTLKRTNRKKYHKLVFDKHEIVRKSVRIDFEQAKCWMERDRNSDSLKVFQFKCMKCLYVWKSKKQLKEHNGKYHSESSGPYFCDMCSSRFKQKSYLQFHLKSHSKGLQCSMCGYNCYSTSVMKVHLKGHKSEVQCLICDVKIQNISLFNQHYKDMHNSFVCDICGKRTRFKRMLERHMRNVHNFATFECKQCNRKYKTGHNLRNHVWLHHSTLTNVELAYCVTCDKQFDTAALYRQHVKYAAIHAAERTCIPQVQCPECPKVYARRTNMMNHYRYVHMKKTKYYCSLCDQYFLNSTKYVEHVKYNHQGVVREKNKICTICGRGFNVNKTLINHMRTHTGERPYECPHCDRRFTQQYAMKMHVKNVHGKRKGIS